MITNLMNIQVKGHEEEVPIDNPFNSKRNFEEIENLNRLKREKKQDINDLYSVEMVELIQSKLKRLYKLIQENEDEMPDGSMIEIVEKLTWNSRMLDKTFDRHEFLKKVKYGHQIEE